MKLFEPITIRGVEIRNRIVMPAMTTRLADLDGGVTPELIDYYFARAQGGAGLITVEMCSPDPAGRHRTGELGIYDDRFVPGLRDLAIKLKEVGVRTCIQIGHAGGHTRRDVTGYRPVAPSELPHIVQEVDTRTVIPEALTHQGIQAIIAAFADTVDRAKKAGFDTVELHGAHGYLIAQFLSPLDNHRIDEYGGNLPNRARFALEVIQACRQRLGNFPIIFRLSADEYAPGGLTLDEAKKVSSWAAEAGADAIHVSAGCYRSLPSGAIATPPMKYPEGVFLHLAAAIKAFVNVPVITVGRLHDPMLAAQVVGEKRADMVALGRQLIADPEWPKKVQEGRIHEIRPCISCNSCVDTMREGRGIHCLVNPTAGREVQYECLPTARPRRIMVVGGGPAGMEAARVLRSRGHRVVLFEKGENLGGQLQLAAKAPFFENVEVDESTLLKFVHFLSLQLKIFDVEIKLMHQVTPHVVGSMKPDIVILATGASYRFPFDWIVPRILNSRWMRTKMVATVMKRTLGKRLFISAIRKPNDGLKRRISALGVEVQSVGDCHRPGTTSDAMEEAVAIACRL
jgi:2,4-dienoyl-CoA reductase-like NADH-dependent reductase (Old Yellow Enzyme family)